MVKTTNKQRAFDCREARPYLRSRFTLWLSFTPRPHHRSWSCSLVAVLMLCLLLSLAGCGTASSNSSTTAPKAALPAMQGFVATLEDDVRDLPEGNITWSTYWKLCWAEYPGAQAYELQTMTGEGASPRLRRQTDRCFRLQSAAGENKKSQGLLNRELQLALQSGQLAYRVRAVLSDGRLSPWSPAMPVGKTTQGGQAASPK